MTATRHERYPVSLIQVPERIRRHVDEDKVSALADSIAKIGLMTPITVYIGAHGPKKITDPILVAGLHRLLAARKLGSYDIPCIVTSANQTERRMWEIAENLHRAELTAQERADHIAEWVRLSSKPGQVAHVSGGRGNQGGISAAARDLGVERTEVRRAVKIASITPEAKEAAKGAGLDDNQSALQKIAAVPKDEQVATVERITRDRENRSANLRREPTPEELAHDDRVASVADYIVDRVQERPKHLKDISLDVVCDALSRAREMFANYDVEIG